ncbi:MAG TPA: hypothetical protein LFW21_04370 [Rickettsia endosymbiont of Pyrocoelia pectoralis]|nr:hypothetical protein [Rickettsia endosymbiont of Pyrocoelia pectoralis]
MVEVIKEKPNLAEEIFKTLKQLFINPKICIHVKDTIAVSLIKILKVMNIVPAFRAFKALTTNSKVDKYIKYEVITSLAEIVKAIPVDGINYRYINELLNIIYLSRIENAYKELYIEAKATLQKITHHITREYEKSKNPEVIEWFNECFEELPRIDETRIFLKEICKSILKGGSINENESKFILNCIKNYHFTFTVSINKEQGIEGQIIFEDKNYEIFESDNLVSLEEFATKLLEQSDDPLAEQYKTHKPLFPNKGAGLRIAASDISNVNSIADENTKLSNEKYLLSYAGDNKDKFTMLLEKRSIFGNHLIYKVGNDNLKKTTIYPMEISKELREQIFNELESKEQFACFIKNKKLKIKEEKQIFRHSNKLKLATKIMQNEKIVLETTNLKLLDAGANKRLNAHETEIHRHKKILDDSGTTQRAEIFREIERLEQDCPLMYVYCNIFYHNTKRIIDVCPIAETKFFENNTDNEKTKLEKMALFIIENFPAINGTLDFITKAFKNIAGSILNEKNERNRENKTTSVSDIIINKIGMRNIDDCLMKIAVTVTYARKNEIINAKTVFKPSPSVLERIKKFIFPKELEKWNEDNGAVQLAYKDSFILMEYLYTHRDEILTGKSDLCTQCVNIITNGILV